MFELVRFAVTVSAAVVSVDVIDKAEAVIDPAPDWLSAYVGPAVSCPLIVRDTVPVAVTPLLMAMSFAEFRLTDAVAPVPTKALTRMSPLVVVN